MKTPRLFATGLFVALTSFLSSSGFAQGSLTPPPGAPAPTMKTLDQVEARTIVNATNTPGDATNMFIISSPGSYYLTGNITGDAGKHGISVLASNVTLDLNGFALIGSGGGAARGVTTTTAIVNFCIRNGNVRGWAGGGVWAGAAVVLAEKLLLSDNVGGVGLAVGNGSMVKDCMASGNATGFYCPDRTQISHCIATVNTGNGFDCTSYVNIIDCTSSRNGGNGIVTLGGCLITRCSATRNLPGGSGIVAGGNCSIVDCTAGNNGAVGISAGSGCTIADCTVDYNGTDGITVTSVGSIARGNTIRNCTARGNGNFGIDCLVLDCHVIGNTCDSNARAFRWHLVASKGTASLPTPSMGFQRVVW
jgi:hypothetical protein